MSMTVVEDTELREAALDRLKKRRDFHAHLLVYVMFNSLVWAIWALTGQGGFPWPLLLSGFWGVGLVMNAWDVYARKPFTEEQVRHEMDRLRHA
jgi:hypothetical protein